MNGADSSVIVTRSISKSKIKSHTFYLTHTHTHTPHTHTHTHTHAHGKNDFVKVPRKLRTENKYLKINFVDLLIH